MCEKLKDIEKRTQELNDEERFLIDTKLNIESLPQNADSNSSHHHHHHQQSSGAYNQRQNLCDNLSSSSSSSGTHAVSLSDHSRRTIPSENAVNDIDNDPKKRYFRAFPALSKEMEDSFRIWRRNAKSLTWPIVGRSSVVVADAQNRASNSIISSSASSSSNLYAQDRAADKVVEKKPRGDNEVSSGDICCGTSVGGIGTIGTTIGDDVAIQGAAVGAAASAKKKSKRRRNQGKRVTYSRFNNYHIYICIPY